MHALSQICIASPNVRTVTFYKCCNTLKNRIGNNMLFYLETSWNHMYWEFLHNHPHDSIYGHVYSMWSLHEYISIHAGWWHSLQGNMCQVWQSIRKAIAVHVTVLILCRTLWAILRNLHQRRIMFLVDRKLASSALRYLAIFYFCQFDVLCLFRISARRPCFLRYCVSTL